MMNDIQHVAPGQPVKAQLMNDIIDALAGPMTPTDELGFQRTSSGSLVMSRIQAPGSELHANASFMDVALVPASGDLSADAHQEVVIQLGRDLASAKDELPGKPEIIFFNDITRDDSMTSAVASCWLPNGSKAGSDGWVHTKITDITQPNGKEDDDSLSSMDGCLWYHLMQCNDSKQSISKKVAVMANTSDSADFEKALSTALQLSGIAEISKQRLAMMTKGPIFTSSSGTSLSAPGWIVNVKKSGTSGSSKSIPGVWQWPTDGDGNWLAPGDSNATMRGAMLLGNVFYDFGTFQIPKIPETSSETSSETSATTSHTLMISANVRTTMGSPVIYNKALIWSDSLSAALSGSPAVSLSSMIFPVYEHNGTEPTFDFKLGTFGLPIYATF